MSALKFVIEDMNDSNSCCGSQIDASTTGNCERYGDGKRKKSLRQLYKDMTWSSFCKAAFEGSNFDLFELYIARYLEKSKKLKFLKCWMKQIIKVNQCFLTILLGSKSVEEISACNNLLRSPAKVAAKPVSKLETSETFFNDLSDKIKHGLDSGMDLQNLVERVVKSSIHWSRHKWQNDNNCKGQEIMRNSDDCYSEAVEEKLIELLPRVPKGMKKIHQDSSSEHAVREYEMQILLRLEILRSDVSATMGESRKQKLLKQICSLLEIIQYLVAGGIHGHVSLYNYVEQSIRARYADELEDVVKEIYTRMDLLPFGDYDETPNLLFNKMKVVVAYLLTVLGGNARPCIEDVKDIFSSVEAEANDDRIELLLTQVKNRDVTDLIVVGHEKLVSVLAGVGAAVVVVPADNGGGVGLWLHLSPRQRRKWRIKKKQIMI